MLPRTQIRRRGIKSAANRSRPWLLPESLVAGGCPGVQELRPFTAKLSSMHPVTGEFLDNIRNHGLGIGNIQFALRNRAIALLGEAAPVQRRGQSRIDLEGGVKIGNGVFGHPAL